MPAIRGAGAIYSLRMRDVYRKITDARLKA